MTTTVPNSAREALDDLWNQTLEAIAIGRDMNALRLRLEASGHAEAADELTRLARGQVQLSSRLNKIAVTLGEAFVDNIRNRA